MLYEKLNNSLKPSLDKLDEYIDLQTTTNSSRKGNVSETKLENVLNKCFPNSSIVNTCSTPQSGDFLLEYKCSTTNTHADDSEYISIIFENNRKWTKSYWMNL